MSDKAKLILVIYMPWILAKIFSLDPIASFFIAWIGSFYIFYVTIFSSLAPFKTPGNGNVEVMKPIILVQLIFAGFMCCTSIFYFIEHVEEEAMLISQCQQLSLLAHSSLVVGIVLITKIENSEFSVAYQPSLRLILSICALSFMTAKALDYLPSFIQFKFPLQVLSITTAVYLLVKGIAAKNISYALIGFAMFSIHFIESTLTGFKEGIIVQILTLIFVSFHFFKTFVLTLGAAVLLLALYILPTYTTVMREKSWQNGDSTSSARDQAYQTFFNEENDQMILETNWKFLTNRFSEIGMFVKYVKHTPDHQDYTGTEIINNVVISLVPRILWEDKPITEHVAMQRVYDAGVAKTSSNVSAKTRPVVDGYLIAGATGVVLVMLSYGMVTQMIFNTAERLFGGYELGGIVMFNSLFQQLWRGNTLEFLVNNIICGLLLMYSIYVIMNSFSLLSKKHLK
jgi:hypothetical protein